MCQNTQATRHGVSNYPLVSSNIDGWQWGIAP